MKSRIVLHVARPGLMIGKKGQEIEVLQTELQDLIGRRVNLKMQEISRPELQAQIVAEDIAEQLVEASQFSADDEARDGTDDGGGSQGNQDSIGRPFGWSGNGPT